MLQCSSALVRLDVDNKAIY